MVLIAFNAQEARPALPADAEPGQSPLRRRGPGTLRRGWGSVGIAGNEISRWEARTAAGGRLVGAGLALLRYRRLSRHLRRNSEGAAALKGRAPTAAGTASPCSGERRGLPGGAVVPRGLLAGLSGRLLCTVRAPAGPPWAPVPPP